jgi:hypothetical protein
VWVRCFVFLKKNGTRVDCYVGHFKTKKLLESGRFGGHFKKQKAPHGEVLGVLSVFKKNKNYACYVIARASQSL